MYDEGLLWFVVCQWGFCQNGSPIGLSSVRLISQSSMLQFL